MAITRKQKTNFLMLVGTAALGCAFLFKDAGPLLFLVAFLAVFLAGFAWSVGLYASFHEEESRRRSKG